MMKKKFRNLVFLSLGCAALVAPIVANAIAEGNIVTKADYATSSFTVTTSNFHLNYTDRTSTGDIVYFKLPEWSIAATEGGNDRFNGEGVVTLIRVDGTETSYKCNIAKQTAGTAPTEGTKGTESGWYIQFDCWDGGKNKFTANVGDKIRINGTATRSKGDYAGDSVTFENIVLTRYEEAAWGVSQVEHTFRKNDLVLGTQNATTLYFDDKTGTDFDISRDTDWPTTVLRAKNAVVYTNASTGETTNYDMGIKLTHQNASMPTSVCIQVSNTWAGVAIPVTPGVGDKFLIQNQSFKLNYAKSNTLYTITIEHIEFEWNGSKWSCPIDKTITYSYQMIDFATIKTEAKIGTTYLPHLYLEHSDEFPIYDSWGRYYIMKDGGTIIPADGSEPIVKDLMMMRLKQSNEYSILFYGAESWSRPWFYDFQAGDKLIVNGTFSADVGYDRYVVTLNSIDLTFNGSAFELNFYRPELIAETHAAIQAIGEVTLTQDCLDKINVAKELLNKLIDRESAEISAEEANTLYKAERDYNALAAEATGKTVHRSLITKEDYTLSITSASGKYFQLSLKDDLIHDYDYPLMNEWDKGINQSLHSSKITTVDGKVTFVPTDAVFGVPKAEKDYCGYMTIYYVTWGTASGAIANDYNFAVGDTLEIGPTGFAKSSETDYYIIEFEGISLVYGEEALLLASEAPNFVNTVRTINNIGEVTLTAACKARIDAARTAYDGLSKKEKEAIPSYEEKVIAAENEYKVLFNQNEASKVVEKINAIGTVEYTAACKAKIDEARRAYDSASLDVKQYITEEQYRVLTDAEAKYLDLGYGIEAAAVLEKINAIGTVEYTAACKAKIDEARSIYNASSDGAKDKITAEQYKVLTDAEAEYARLKATDDFITEVAKLNDDLSIEQMYSIINNALRYYNKIEDKESVAPQYATLEAYIAKYNARLAPINQAHEEATNSALSIINVVLTATSLLAVAALVLSKKGIM